MGTGGVYEKNMTTFDELGLRFFTVGFHERLSGLTALDPFRSWWS